MQMNLNATDKKDGSAAKHLKTFQDSTIKSSQKPSLIMGPIEEVARRKTVVFKQPSKNCISDADRDNALASFSSQRAEGSGMA